MTNPKLLLESKYNLAVRHRTTCPPPTGQEFFKDFCEDESFTAQRRKVLRLSAGLTDKEKHKVGDLSHLVSFSLRIYVDPYLQKESIKSVH